MAPTTPFRYLILLSLYLLYFRSLAVQSSSSFYFNNFNQDSNFESQLALYGDSKVVHRGLSVEINGSSVSGAGRIVYKNPIRLLDLKTKSLVSFSTNFSFSLSRVYGNGLALFMVPVSSFGLLVERNVRLFSVQFDLSIDAKYGDDVASFVSVKVSDVSSVKLVLTRGEKLQAWIDYEASSKRIEVRLTKLGLIKPVDPVLSYSIDMSLMWKENEVLVGLGSSIKGNSSKLCNVYSWGYSSRKVPRIMHSQPLDPEVHVEHKKPVIVRKRSDCLTKILAALIFGTACGALGAIFALFAWTFFGENGRAILPEDYAVQPVKIEYKKFEVVVDKQMEADKQ